MKIRISHRNGQYDEKSDAVLCEVFCTPEEESGRWMLENGWLPTVNYEWYQSRSSRVPLLRETHSRIKPTGIRLSTTGDWRRIVANSKHYYSYLNLEHIEYCVDNKDEIIYFNDVAFAVINLIDGVPYISTVIGTRQNKDILRHVIPVMKEYCFEVIDAWQWSITSDMLYLGEWYDKFSFKSSTIGFEWWDGENWTKK